MSGNTEAIKIMVNNDPAISDEQRKQILDALSRKGGRQRPKLISKKAVADIIECSTKTVDRYTQRGYLHPIHFSQRKIRFDEAAVLEFARTGIDLETKRAVA